MYKFAHIGDKCSLKKQGFTRQLGVTVIVTDEKRWRYE